ncbi:hypothetical protein Bbelb_035090 [Branchiostoma belcheri]|nr:hypothetical protein Bbelb_035090 [Branchiostoma belcheri]
MGVSSRTVCRVISENTAIMRSTPIPEAGEIWAYDNVNIVVNVQLLRQVHSAKMIDTRKSNHQRDRIMKPECIHYYRFMGPVDRYHQMVSYLSSRRRTLKEAEEVKVLYIAGGVICQCHTHWEGHSVLFDPPETPWSVEGDGSEHDATRPSC